MFETIQRDRFTTKLAEYLRAHGNYRIELCITSTVNRCGNC